VKPPGAITAALGPRLHRLLTLGLPPWASAQTKTLARRLLDSLRVDVLHHLSGCADLAREGGPRLGVHPETLHRWITGNGWLSEVRERREGDEKTT